MKQIMQDYTGIYYANPYELTGINDRVQDFVPRADGQLFFITSDDGETITRNTSGNGLIRCSEQHGLIYVPGSARSAPRGCLKTVFSDRLFESAAGPDGMACAPRHQAAAPPL